MSQLTSKTRSRLKGADFAFPGRRAYPIHDEVHARDALARVAQNGTPAEQAIVQEKVRKRYPGIAVAGKKGNAPVKTAKPAAPNPNMVQDTDQDNA